MTKSAYCPLLLEAGRDDCARSWKIGRGAVLVMLFLAVITAVDGLGISRAKAEEITSVDAVVVALNIPGASAVTQIGTFLNVPPPGSCSNPIPTKFPTYIQPGAVLDPNRIMLGSASNFGAPRAIGAGAEGSLLSIDPSHPGTLSIPPDFASGGGQASTLAGAVQMFSANAPDWLNGIHNPNAATKHYTGVSNPLGLSLNNAFGRVWPANSPFGSEGVGSSSILDPTGLPLAGAPNPVIGGVYVGNLTNRDAVTNPPQPQVIPGGLNTGAIGTALLGPSPDGSCKAVFVVVTADGAIVQEHTLKGLDGLAPPGTIRPIIGRDENAPISPRFGVIMNPYTQSSTIVRQLFVSEPFHDTIAVVDLTVAGTVFALESVARIDSPALKRPVDLAPVKRDKDNVNWAGNATLDEGSDFYVANQGDNTIVRMRQDGTVVAIRRVTIDGQRLDDVRLNGIAASADATDTALPSTIFATFVDDGGRPGGLLAMPAF